LRQALDTVGAFIGPLLAIALMAAFAGNMRTVFWAAIAPAILSVVLVLFGVEDRNAADKARPPIHMRDLSALGSPFWLLMLVAGAFTFARFSESFLILKAHANGLPTALAPLVLVVMNIVYAGGAYPAGALADRASPRALLLFGIAVLIAADLSLAFIPGLAGAFLGIGLWGAHLALTQGVFAKLVADSAPEQLRASAFGIFNLLTGLALLVASIVAGLAWDRFGADAAFIIGAGFAACAAILAASTRPRRL
jgi:predicted MFS family arabinose efflux permease